MSSANDAAVAAIRRRARRWLWVGLAVFVVYIPAHAVRFPLVEGLTFGVMFMAFARYHRGMGRADCVATHGAGVNAGATNPPG